MLALGSLIVFAKDFERVVLFYRELGVGLEEERHGEGPAHVAADIGGLHFAVFDASADQGEAPPYRSPGSAYWGFRVADVRERVSRLRGHGFVVRQEPEVYPWGLRALIDDPDGRVVELFEAC